MTTSRPPVDEGPIAGFLRRRRERAAMRARVKADLARAMQNPTMAAAVARAKARRRRRQLALLLAILLLLLLFRCECDEAPLAPEPPAEVEAPVVEKKPTTRKGIKKPLTLEGTVEKSERDTIDVPDLPPPAWLAQFRLQAAARSPRLAACFVGVEKPGALRWSALVHARSGRVSESVVEPVFRGGTVTDTQLACLIAALSDPPFSLDEPDREAAPRRVSLIFEF